MPAGLKEVTGKIVKAELDNNGNIIVKEIFGYAQSDTLDDGTVVGDFIKNKGTPSIYSKIVRRGINDLDTIFKKG